jgi:hypothetical protein
MIISLYLFLTWFTIGIWFTWPNRMPKQQHFFALLIATFFTSNSGYLLADPIGFYEMSKEMLGYVSFTLYQSFIIPAVLALVCNAFFMPALRKSVVVLISICAFLALDLLARKLNLFTYTGNWHLPALVGYRLLLLFFTIFAVKGFKRMCKP